MQRKKIKKAVYRGSHSQSKRLSALINLLVGQKITDQEKESLQALNLIEEKEGQIVLNSMGRFEIERLLSFYGIDITMTEV